MRCVGLPALVERVVGGSESKRGTGALRHRFFVISCQKQGLAMGVGRTATRTG
jgi:hypothetical protein